MIEVIADELKTIADEALVPYLHDRSAVRRQTKVGGEPVSQVDILLEQRLTRFLRGFFPYVSIVGEESAGAAPGWNLDEGTVWLIDPLDGTGNFLAGSDDFAVMLCRLVNGKAVTAWIYLPARGVVAMAEAGSGAVMDGVRIKSSASPVSSPPPAVPAEMAGEVHAGFLPEGLKARIVAAQSNQPGRRPRFCAGATYVGMVRGDCDYALYYRTRPWDHAPGTLLVEETGGRAARFDGVSYRPGDGGSGLLVTAAANSWDRLATYLLVKA